MEGSYINFAGAYLFVTPGGLVYNGGTICPINTKNLTVKIGTSWYPLVSVAKNYQINFSEKSFRSDAYELEVIRMRQKKLFKLNEQVKKDLKALDAETNGKREMILKLYQIQVNLLEDELSTYGE